MTYFNPTTIPTDGLVAYYKLDGDATDSSGNGNNGTATNVTWVGADRGYVEEVGSFNGTSSFINVSSSSLATLLNGRNPFSISFQVNLNTLTAGQIMLDTRGSDFNGLFIELDSSAKFKSVRSDGAVADIMAICNNAKTTGVWCNLTITYDGTNGQIYADGIPQTGGTSTRTLNSNGDFKIGKGFAGNSSFGYLNGFLGNVAIYNRALSQEEINTLYLEGLRQLGQTSELNKSQGFPFYSTTRLQEGKVLEISRPQSGGVYYDQTGNGNNGTPTNVTDSTVGVHNVMTISSGGISWPSIIFSTSSCWELISGKWVFKINPSYITSTGVSTGTRTISNIKLWSNVLSSEEELELQYSSTII